MFEPAPPDYLLIGHLTKDQILSEPDRGESRVRTTPTGSHGWRPGGTVLYSGVTAQRLGRRVGIVTRHASTVGSVAELGEIAIRIGASFQTTTFAFGAEGPRVLRLVERAADIDLHDVPAGWMAAPLVHLAPVVGEVPLALTSAFGESWVGATAQGWLRSFAPGFEVVGAALRRDPFALASLQAVVLSEEDLAGSTELPERISPERISIEDVAERVPLVVLTMGDRGAMLFDHGRPRHVAPFPAHDVDSTGAGDVFAASFFIRFVETQDPLESARFASCAAALSIGGVGTSRIPTRQQVISAVRDAHAA